MSTEAPSLRSPFFNVSKHWTENEQATFNKAHIKAKEIELQVQKCVSNLIYSPSFQSQFPQLFFIAVKWMQKPKEEPVPESIEWIGPRVIKHLMKERIDFDVKFADTLNHAHNAVIKHLDGSGGLNFSSYCLISQFLRSYLSFLQKNESDCQTPKILDALTRGLPCFKDSEKPDIHKLRQDISDILNAVDTAYFSVHSEDLKRYKIFISSLEKIVLLIAKGLMQPDQYRKTISDNPIELGLGLRHNIMEKMMSDKIKEVISSDEFTKEAVTSLARVMKIRQSYIEAPHEKERFAFAREILEEFDESLLQVPVSLKLNALCTLSRNSEEFPVYFKKLALELCKQVIDFEKEEPEKKSETPGCPIM